MILTKFVIYVVCILLAIAFFTLLERKILGHIQLRKGPNKLYFMGVFQPFSDAVKLIMTESTSLKEANYLLYFLSPILAFFNTMLMWMMLGSKSGVFEISLGIIFMLCCLSVGVYFILSASWSSNSKYAMLGGLRAVAQTISYEVSLIIILMSFTILINSYDVQDFTSFNMWFIFMSPPLASIWFLSSLAETSRTPFDFSEGESELVSGFNTEYSSGGFVLFFLAEYSSILFMSVFFSYVFMGSSTFIVLKTMVIAYLFVWVRGSLPRFRYDKLMNLTWKVFLPFSLSSLILFFSFSIYLNMIL